MTAPRFTYAGKPVPRLWPVAFCEGADDAARFDRFEQLYRRPWWKRALYGAGYYAAKVLAVRVPREPRPPNPLTGVDPVHRVKVCGCEVVFGGEK